LKIVFVGDIVGSPGRRAFARFATRWKNEGKADIIVANAENSASGRGPTPAIAQEILDAGADALTLGDHTWDQKELAPFLDRESRIARPANFAPGCPGKGFVRLETPEGPLLVISLIGRVFLPPRDCPLRAADALLKKESARVRMIMVDMHCEATSEKIIAGRYLDGRVSLVAGTHTHVQTSDETILPKGTAYITDAGMTGPKDSVLGRDYEPVLRSYLTGMPNKFDVATQNVCVEGVCVDIDPKSGKALNITRFRESMV
jgi:2',3'-cyclic-nucleotide 2'-phosphodiesterase